MNNEPNIAHVAALIGEPTRAKMMIALMSGKALTATELAVEADISSSTASSHLTKLVNSKLLMVRKQGRHKYFQIGSQEVAALIESLLNISSRFQVNEITTGPSDKALRKSRVCYDHLAGELAVDLMDILKEKALIIPSDNDWQLSDSGKEFFNALGFVSTEHKQKKRPLCKACLDWSERRDHVAGALGQWILNDIFDQGWATKALDSRVVIFSSAGLKKFKQRYQLSTAAQ